MWINIREFESHLHNSNASLAYVHGPTIGIRTEQILWNVCVSSLASAVGKWKLTYEGCPEIIQPFWISREPVVWSWCHLAASQRRPYCASVKSLSRGLVSRQWDVVDWVCVPCDRRIHSDRTSRSASSLKCACPFYSSHAGVFGKASHHNTSPRPVSSPTAQIWLPATYGFSQS